MNKIFKQTHTHTGNCENCVQNWLIDNIYKGIKNINQQQLIHTNQKMLVQPAPAKLASLPKPDNVVR